MRDYIARFVCALSLVTVIVLAGVFAARHNPRPASPAQSLPTAVASHPPTRASSAQIERGRTLFTELECATCHSLHGQGNPRRPLDGSGTRWNADDLTGRITGTGAITLTPAVLKRKQRYQDLPREDLAALIAFISTPASEPALSKKPWQ